MSYSAFQHTVCNTTVIIIIIIIIIIIMTILLLLFHQHYITFMYVILTKTWKILHYWYYKIQDEHKVFPWLQTFITRKLCGIQIYIFLPLFKLVSKTLCHMFIVMLQKYVCIPRSFLVINVCNQGKNLSSPCISIGLTCYSYSSIMAWHT